MSSEFRRFETMSKCDLIDILSMKERLRGTVLFMSFSLVFLRKTGDSLVVSSALLDLSSSPRDGTVLFLFLFSSRLSLPTFKANVSSTFRLFGLSV